MSARGSLLTPTIARRLVAVVVRRDRRLAHHHPSSCSTSSLTLDLYVTPDAWEADKELVLLEPIDAFNRARIMIDGQIIQIEPTTVDSGTAQQYLEESTGVPPDVWIPASSVWERLLRVSRPELLPADTSSLFSSPQVFAVWEPLAQSIGSSLGWNDIHRFATDLDAWREVAGPSATRSGSPISTPSARRRALPPRSPSSRTPSITPRILRSTTSNADLESSVRSRARSSTMGPRRGTCSSSSRATGLPTRTSSMSRKRRSIGSTTGNTTTDDCRGRLALSRETGPVRHRILRRLPLHPHPGGWNHHAGGREVLQVGSAGRIEADPLHLVEYFFRPSTDRLRPRHLPDSLPRR